MGTYNIPSQQSLSIADIAPLLNSQKAMEKYFVHILSVHTLQRPKSKENRKEDIATCRCLSLGQKCPLLHEKHHGASTTTAYGNAFQVVVETGAHNFLRKYEEVNEIIPGADECCNQVPYSSVSKG